MRPYQDAERIAADPEYGRIVCFCERVTAGEIRDAFDSPIPPADLDGLRRRTRVMNGRCQGFYCGAGTITDGAAATPSGDGRDDARAARAPVAIVGGGPAGLTAAAALAGQVDGEVLVLEREAETGGIPRHSDHPGYGMRDLKRFISGPAYARRLTAMAHGRGRDAGDRGDGHRLGRRTRAAGHLAARAAHRHGRRRGAGHRRAGAAAAGAADPRRPARRRLHHRPAAEPRAPAPREGRHAVRCRRRRTGQLVGGVDPARSRLRHSREWSAAIRTRSRTRRSGCPAGC